MIKAPGVLLRITRSLIPHARQLRFPILLINCYLPCLSFAHCVLYSYHFSLVIGMMLRLVGLKECGLGTHILVLGWPLSEVVTRFGAEEDLFQSSPPHKSGMPSWSGDREHYTTPTPSPGTGLSSFLKTEIVSILGIIFKPHSQSCEISTML